MLMLSLKEIRSRKFPSIREVLENLYRLKTLVRGGIIQMLLKVVIRVSGVYRNFSFSKLPSKLKLKQNILNRLISLDNFIFINIEFLLS